MDMTQIRRLVEAGESETLEFKKSTAQLSRAGETLCAFLNGSGGRVLIGVTGEGKVVGQQVSDKTQRELAAFLQRFEPPAPIEIRLTNLAESELKVIVLNAPPAADSLPFTFNDFRAPEPPHFQHGLRIVRKKLRSIEHLGRLGDHVFLPEPHAVEDVTNVHAGARGDALAPDRRLTGLKDFLGSWGENQQAHASG